LWLFGPWLWKLGRDSYNQTSVLYRPVNHILAVRREERRIQNVVKDRAGKDIRLLTAGKKKKRQRLRFLDFLLP